MNYRRIFIKNSLVFLTLVTQNRVPILINDIALLKKSLINTLKLYKYKVIAYVILPDHIHCIIKPKNISDYSNIIKSFKYSFGKEFRNKHGRYGKVWQNRFWEHTIRNEKDLNNHLNYIHYNPVKHNLCNSVKEWRYSSFYRFVKRGLYEIDWGSFKDIESIKDLNFE